MRWERYVEGMTIANFNAVFSRSGKGEAEQRLRVSDNRALRKISGSKRALEAWRRPHSEELNGLYCAPNISRAIKSIRKRGAGYVASCGGGGGACRVLLRKSERKRQLGSTRHLWEDNIKIYSLNYYTNHCTYINL